MNDFYIYDNADLLERVFAAAHDLNISFEAVERGVSYSPFFQMLEKDDLYIAPTIDDESLVKSIFPKEKIDLANTPVYVLTLWAAESYIRIQRTTRLTFEAIFLFMPMSEMYRCFDLYHEMPFSQIVDRFYELYHENNALNLILEKKSLSLKDVSKYTNIPLQTLYSLKNGKRSLAKMNADNAIRLASFLRVRVETLIQMQL